MSARLTDSFYVSDATRPVDIHAKDRGTEWSVLPDAWPDADVPLLAAREVGWVTVAIVVTTIAVLLGLG